jgi:hypothetical protein
VYVILFSDASLPVKVPTSVKFDFFDFSAKLDYPTVILADFNIYNNTEYPIDVLTKPSLSEGHFCSSAVANANLQGQLRPLFTDVWKHVYSQEEEQQGYTFSNMPWPGMISRPDRIMVRLRNFFQNLNRFCRTKVNLVIWASENSSRMSVWINQLYWYHYQSRLMVMVWNTSRNTIGTSFYRARRHLPHPPTENSFEVVS